jgi:hypothetical protein
MTCRSPIIAAPPASMMQLNHPPNSTTSSAFFNRICHKRTLGILSGASAYHLIPSALLTPRRTRTWSEGAVIASSFRTSSRASANSQSRQATSFCVPRHRYLWYNAALRRVYATGTDGMRCAQPHGAGRPSSPGRLRPVTIAATRFSRWTMLASATPTTCKPTRIKVRLAKTS